MHRLIHVLVLSCLLVAVASPLWAADAPQLLFYGIVTVRDGTTVLHKNPKLTDEQLAQCREALEGSIDLERTFTTSTADDGTLNYTWGEDKDVLTHEGLVPYVAYFVTPGEFIDIEESAATPVVDVMGTSCSTTTGAAEVVWWAPETTEAVSLALTYYDSSCYEPVAELTGKAIAADAQGTSPDGVNWTIASVDRKDDEVVINVETAKGPDGHRFDFWIATRDWDEPQHDAPWTNESDDGSKLIYPVLVWLDEDDELISFEIRERHPDRIKTWAVKDFTLDTE